MELRCHQQKQRDRKFCSKWKMKGPEEAGDDEQPGEAKNEMENRASPEWIDTVSSTYVSRCDTAIAGGEGRALI